MNIELEKSFFTNGNINDDLFYASLIRELEEFVEEELSKDVEEINAELIDDCCVAIENLQAALSGEEVEKYEAFLGVERIIKQHNKKSKTITAASVACAVVAVICAVVSAKTITPITQGSIKGNGFWNDVFNVYEETVVNPETKTTVKELTTSVTQEITTAYEKENTTSYHFQIPQHENESSVTVPETTNPIPMVHKIVVLLPPGFKTEYTDKSQIDLSKVYVEVCYSDETEKVVSIDECKVEIGEPDNKGRTKITVKYNHQYANVYVNVRAEKEKNPVTLNSIYGNFNGGYNVESMSVYAVYSDGSEKEIPKGEYTIKTEYSEDFEAELVTVEYGGCSFQFLPQNLEG